MKKLPIGIQTFSEIREENYIYVDKTKYIYKLATEGKVYFLSRPRRFGKSLLLSTIENLFKGNKKLFKGLYIHDKWNWEKTNPVIKIDFTKGKFISPEDLEDTLKDTLDEIAENFQIELKRRTTPNRFAELIKKIRKKTNKPVVILIDEYDKAIVDNIAKKNVLKNNQEILKSFYDVLKGTDEYIKFLFITGVSKFANMSLFSSLNNLDDITLNRNFACICGYTHQDLKNNFKPYLNNLKEELSIPYDETVEKINYWYDGYSWDGKNKVYNPFSTLKLFNDKKFSNYWFGTATPEFLIEVLKNSKDYKEVLKPIIVEESHFMAFDYNNIDPINIFFQTGYLTIVEEIIINDIIHYKLEFPNFEVEKSLLTRLMDLNLYKEKIGVKKEKIISYIEKMDNNNFQKEMKAFLAKIPSRIHIEQEYYYQSIFLAWLNALSFETEGESPTNIGFTDMILKEEGFVVVAEFKFSKINPNTNIPVISYDKMLKTAMDQIKDKKYYEKYLDKKIIAIAIAFAGKELQTQIYNCEK